MNNLNNIGGSPSTDLQAMELANQNHESAESDSDVFMKMLMAQQQHMKKPDDDDESDD